MGCSIVADSRVRHAAVLGSPIRHSRSPQLHLAAYRALGLDSWTYDRRECTAEQLPGLVSGLGTDWVGLSVTMPAKEAALSYAGSCSDRAALVGSANTLTRQPDGGWRADCTDIDGVSGALSDAGLGALTGRSAVVLGAGSTARAALYALSELGAEAVTLVAREPRRADTALALAAALNLSVRVAEFGTGGVKSACAEAAVVVSTIPATAAAVLADDVASAPAVLDVVYDPWPTPLTQTVLAAGGTAIGGLNMLLYQAYSQVEQFTGQPAPRAEMAAALVG